MISAVTFAHTLNGFQSPSAHPSFSLVLKGIRRKIFVPPKRAVLLTPQIVMNLMSCLVGADLEVGSFYNVQLIDWRTVAFAVLTFSALARFDCACKLEPKHLDFGNEILTITFPPSKTDQIGEGMKVSVHRTNNESCPVNFLESYLDRLHWEASLETQGTRYSGPILPTLTTRKVKAWFGEAISSLPAKAGTPFSRSAATIALRKGLEKIGHPNASSFTLHSGRRGGASAAVAAGCDLVTLKRQGRWKSDSCPQLYIDENVSLKTNFSKFLSL